VELAVISDVDGRLIVRDRRMIKLPSMFDLMIFLSFFLSFFLSDPQVGRYADVCYHAE